MAFVLYFVHARHDAFEDSKSSVTKSSKSKAHSDDALYFDFSVLCRTKHDALRAWEFHFQRKLLSRSLKNYSAYDINDYTVSLQRVKIDSRGFTPTYLIADRMKQPLILSDLVSDNVSRLNSIF